jgi:hypothetical protein
MIKLVHDEVWVFDVEWVPDVASGRRAYELAADLDDRAVLEEMWRRGGATQADPRPYLKTILCRVVSIAAVIRKRTQGGSVSLNLFSLPEPGNGAPDEATLVSRFLTKVGKVKPQLVGFNSQSADLVVLQQRALVHGLSLPEFCARPNKPWEGPDYFARHSDHHIDLKEEFGGWGKATPSLHEFATACRIPGKTDTDGTNVVDLWLAGNVRRIVQYNECDAISTYLVWLRAALMAGHVTPQAFQQEEQQLETLLEARSKQPGHEHLGEYLTRWRALRA